MEWLNSLFFEHTPLQAVVILSIIIAVGLGLGKIHVFGISLGVTFVFFAGILAGHLGFSIDSNMLNYAESFLSEEEILRSINEGDREAVGRTMPAKGLTLESVEYGIKLF